MMQVRLNDLVALRLSDFPLARGGKHERKEAEDNDKGNNRPGEFDCFAFHSKNVVHLIYNGEETVRFQHF